MKTILTTYMSLCTAIHHHHHPHQIIITTMMSTTKTKIITIIINNNSNNQDRHLHLVTKEEDTTPVDLLAAATLVRDVLLNPWITLSEGIGNGPLCEKVVHRIGGVGNPHGTDVKEAILRRILHLLLFHRFTANHLRLLLPGAT